MLVQLSLIYSMLFVIVLFLMLYEYRCTRRTFIIACTVGMAVLVAVNGGLLLRFGVAAMGRVVLLTCTLPSLVFFYVLAKDRGARFLFTFCLVDTVSAWLMLLTGLLDYFVGGGGVVTFATRLVLFPLLAWAVYRWARRPYREMLHTVEHGWWLFAVLTGLFYLMLTTLSGWPTIRFDRPDDIPVALIVLAVMPLTYATIFWFIGQQAEVMQAKERQRIFQAQAAMIERRAEEVRRSEQQLHIERHDLRHRLTAIASLLRAEGPDAVLTYIGAAQSKLDDSRPKRYCANAVLDAILSSYFAQAQEQGIRVETSLAIPDELPVDAAELSTVFANTLENAIHACSLLPEEERRIVCKCVTGPRLMFEIANPYRGEICFGRDGLPLSQQPGHGIGAQSVMAFAEKHNAICRFRAEDGWFKVQVAL